MPPSPKTRSFDNLEHNDRHSKYSPLTKIVAGVTVLATVLLLLYLYTLKPATPTLQAPEWIYATAVLRGDAGVNGTVYFRQSGLSKVRITGKILGVDKNSLRGFHIHEFGDLSDGCTSTGSHFNPTSQTHGGPSDLKRHVGDLGNVKSDKHGVVHLDFEDNLITLSGPWSIIGRAVVIHKGTDDLGRGGNDESLKTGNAGGRAACGVIGVSRTLA